MFTWICPQCGREVPPSYDECPDCAKKAAAAAPVAVAAPPAAPEPVPVAPSPQPPYPGPPPQQFAAPQQPYPPQQYAPPQQPYPPQPQQPYPPQQQPYPPQQYPPPYQQQQYAAPPPPPFYPPTPARSGMPTWLMTILCALAFGGVVLAAYYFIGNSKKEPSAAQGNTAPMENAAPAGSSALKNNPLLKQVEVVGLRLLQNKAKKTEARFVLVNHSGGEIPDFSATVMLAARTRKKDEEPIGSFSFKAPSMGSYESKELTAPLDTKLKVYELPDWQNLQAQLEFAPQ